MVTERNNTRNFLQQRYIKIDWFVCEESDKVNF